MSTSTLLAATFAALALSSSSFAQPINYTIGEAALPLKPDLWVQGDPVTHYETDRVYVVEFWATWCPPCVKTMPHLDVLQKQYGDRLTIVGVNVDGQAGKTDVPAIRAFVKAKNATYPIAMDEPHKLPMSAAWITGSGCAGIPTAFIIDRQGKLVWVGYPDKVQSYPFDQALEDALAGKIDLARSRALQLTTNQETVKYIHEHPAKVQKD